MNKQILSKQNNSKTSFCNTRGEELTGRKYLNPIYSVEPDFTVLTIDPQVIVLNLTDLFLQFLL